MLRHAIRLQDGVTSSRWTDILVPMQRHSTQYRQRHVRTVTALISTWPLTREVRCVLLCNDFHLLCWHAVHPRVKEYSSGQVDVVRVVEIVARKEAQVGVDDICR